MKSLNFKNFKLSKFIQPNITRNIISLIFGLLITYIAFSAITGHWTILFKGIQAGFKRASTISQIATIFTFILLISLGFSVASKSGLIDISIPGKILMAALIGYLTAFAVKDSPSGGLKVFLCFLTAITSIVIVSLIMIYLKTKFKVNEVMFGILFNLVIAAAYQALTRGSKLPWLDEFGSVYSMGYLLNFSSFKYEYLTWFLFIAVFLAFVLFIFYKWTPLGFKITILGKSPTVAQTIGVKILRVHLYSVLITSLFVALATIVYVFGMQKGTLDGNLTAAPSEGFSAMAVASLSSAHPIAILINAIIFASTSFTKGYIEMTTDLSGSVINIITGILMIVIAITPYVISNAKPWYHKVMSLNTLRFKMPRFKGGA